jgi:hypothetical protein
VDNGPIGRRESKVVCAYSSESIVDEAIYFCETYSSRDMMSDCKNQIARMLRGVFREKSPRCESIYSEETSSSDVLAKINVELKNTNEGVTLFFRENDDVHTLLSKVCRVEDGECKANVFKMLFKNPRTRVKAIDAFMASCDAETLPHSYDLSESFVASGVGKNRVVDEALPRSLFCLMATESMAAFEMMSIRSNPAISHFLKLSDLYRRGPRTGIELAAEHLLNLNFNEKEREEILGLEWWIQYRQGDMKVPFHFDKDEGYTKRSKNNTKMKHPSLSTVTYITSNAQSFSKLPQNPTLVLNYTQQDRVMDLNAFVIPPVANRHVTFSGNLYHGVPETIPSSEHHYPFQIRVTFLVNFWTVQPEFSTSPPQSDENVTVMLNQLPQRHRDRLERALKCRFDYESPTLTTTRPPRFVVSKQMYARIFFHVSF